MISLVNTILNGQWPSYRSKFRMAKNFIMITNVNRMICDIFIDFKLIIRF